MWVKEVRGPGWFWAIGYKVPGCIIEPSPTLIYVGWHGSSPEIEWWWDEPVEPPAWTPEELNCLGSYPN